MKIIMDPRRDSDSPSIAQVSYSNSTGFGTVGASEIRNAPIFSPRGIAYIPCVGDKVLFLPVEGADICAGVLASMSGLLPGELMLYSSGGARIKLDSYGNISLNGLIINGSGKIVST